MFNKVKHTVRRLVCILTVAMIALTVGAAWLTYPNTGQAKDPDKQHGGPFGDLSGEHAVIKGIQDEIFSRQEIIEAIISEAFRPDLVVRHPDRSLLDPTSPHDLCILGGQNKEFLDVTIFNQGLGTTGNDWRVQVEFTLSMGTVLVDPTPVGTPGRQEGILSFNDHVHLFFLIPTVEPSCFVPSCGFTIRVDNFDDEDETNETNNLESGFCVG